MRKVAIVGSAQTAHERRKAEQNVEDMIFETVTALLEQCRLTINDVEMVIGAGDDVLDGRSISNVFTAEYAGAFLKEESKVEDDGAFAACYAFMRIAAGAFDTILVYGYSKSSDSSPQHYSGMMADPFYLRPLGVEALTAAALQAQCYFQKYGASEADAAAVAVKNRRHALRNPFAQVKGEYTVDEVMRSPVIASPIKRLDAAPVTDGCCAMLLMSEEAAQKHGLKPAWIRGVGFCTDSYYPGHRDLTEIRAAHIAAERAYKMAGILEPWREIDLAEIHEPFAFQELMMYEALGFCDKGKGREFLHSGDTDINVSGLLPVNLSGGALSANPIFATGLIRLAEAANFVTGQSANYPFEAKTAVAHATSGFALQSNIVYVIGCGAS
ncbi:MAG TPA: thiolase family protein [Blastocatellia bacterium]|nr:thiolase family protein [Blastocatellia bacterium]